MEDPNLAPMPPRASGQPARAPNRPSSPDHARRSLFVLIFATSVLVSSSLAGVALLESVAAAPSPPPSAVTPVSAGSTPSATAVYAPAPTIDGQAGTGLSNPCSAGSVCVDGPSCFTADSLDGGQGQPWGSASCVLNLTTNLSPDVIILFFTVQTNSSTAVSVTVTDSESLRWSERASFADITPAYFPGTTYPTGCPDTCTLGGYEYWAADYNSPGVDEITVGFVGSILSPPSAMAFGVSGVDPSNPFDAGGPSVSSVPESDYPGQSPATGTISTDSSNDLIFGLLGLENTTSSISTGGAGFEPIGAGAPAPVPTPSITLSPPDAGSGNTVTVTGSGFSPSDTSVNFTGLGSFSFDCEAAYGYVGLSGLTPPCTFVVPTLDVGATGGPLYTITAVGNVEGGAADTATASFDMTPPDLWISPIGPTSGPAGTWVELNGAFFDESTGGVGSVTIDAPGVTPFTCGVTFGAIAVGCYFQIPSGASAPYVITAYGSDYTSNPTDVATTTFEPTYDFSSEAGTLSWGESWSPAGPGGPYAVSASGNFQEWGLIVDAVAPCAPCLTIASTPLAGPVGTQVVVAGTGFTSGQLISSIEFGGTSVECTGGEPTVVGGDFECSFDVPPIDPGSYSVTAFDAVDGAVTSTNEFAVTPVLTITQPTSLAGVDGTPVTVKGTGWTPGDGAYLSLYFDAAPPIELSCSVAPIINAAGAFSCRFPVPAGVTPGVYSVLAKDSSTGAARLSTNSFTVIDEPTMSISGTTIGPIGAATKVTGVGFTSGEKLVLTVGGVDVSCSGAQAPAASVTYGDFTCHFDIPPVPTGTYPIETTDQTAGLVISTNTLTITGPVMTISGAPIGTVGTATTVTGRGFTSDQTLTLDIDGVAGSCAGALSPGIAVVGGDFRCPFTIPAVPPGTYSVETTDETDGLVASANQFTVTGPVLAITGSTIGSIGTKTTLAGTGFTPAEPLIVEIDGAAGGGSCAQVETPSPARTFSCSFIVPTVPAGTYPIETTDETDGPVVSLNTFTVTPPVLTIAGATSGAVGTKTTITGSGFTPSQPLVLTIDGVEGAGSCGSSDLGAVSCHFIVPNIASGTYPVETTDLTDGLVVSTNTFTVCPCSESGPAMTIVGPTSGSIAGLTKITGTGFTSGETLTLSIDGVAGTCAGAQSPGVEVANGGFTCHFTIPAVPPGTFPITTTDEVAGAVGSTNTFTVTPPVFSIGDTSGVLVTMGTIGSKTTVEGSGFTPDETLTFDLGGVFASCGGVLSPGTEVANGGFFSCGITIPVLRPGTYAFETTDKTDGPIGSTDTFTVVPPALTITGATEGGMGTSTVVTGTGFTPDEALAIEIEGVQMSCGGRYAPETWSDNLGSFSCAFIVTGLAPGTYAIETTDVTDGVIGSTNTFTVNPPLLSVTGVTSGGLGTMTTVSGTGFTPDTSLAVEIDGVQMSCGGSVAPDASVGNAGSFACTFVVPNLVPGTYPVETVDETDGPVGSANTFTVV